MLHSFDWDAPRLRQPIRVFRGCVVGVEIRRYAPRLYSIYRLEIVNDACERIESFLGFQIAHMLADEHVAIDFHRDGVLEMSSNGESGRTRRGSNRHGRIAARAAQDLFATKHD